MAKMQVFTIDNLSLYDELLKGYVDAGDAKSLKTVAIEGNTLKFYRVSEPVGDTAPAYTITLPETDLSGLIPKITGATAGNVVTAKADGTVQDSGVAVADLATKAEVKAVDDKAVANANAISAINDEATGILKTAKDHADLKVSELADGAVKKNTDAIAAEKTRAEAAEKVATDAIAVLNGDAETSGSVAKAVKDSADAINATIGTVEEGKTVVQMIADAKTAATYDDTEVRGLISDNADAIEAHKTAIDSKVTTLVGEDVDKSVRTIAAEETAKIVASAPEDFDTLKEIADWIEADKTRAAELTTKVSNNEKAISDEVTRATGVEESLQNAIDAINDAETGILKNAKDYADALDTAMDARVDAIEAALGSDGSVDDKIATAKSEAIASAKEYSDGLNTAMDTRVSDLETKVGDGFEAIPESAIRALFS